MYGYDSQSGQVLVSTDHTTWDRRARVALADFAISPADPNLMLATTQQNLARSADGGRTFTPAAAAPLVQLLDWPKATTLVGLATGSGEIHVATDNGIHTSRDGGRTFTMRVPMS
ncbi:hypothetical protein NQK81_28415 [Amycolatopsis roodepoortensis]|uniref:WD40/YVTN/BNR-like repeat-containing protein n=1 Tax=Amycolatopsis roodepoortensis TaxID=700274 RepID=UPI00214C4D23|nr:hypothetical protein [Amycolatopsis roodepoortensis]UUV28693.1 hypothetical protein NQK81_28415 [Amycolatopsis roodepoortensis]